MSISRECERDPRPARYMDAALTPVADDDDEKLDLLTKTAGAKEAIAHLKKVAALTHCETRARGRSAASMRSR